MSSSDPTLAPGQRRVVARPTLAGSAPTRSARRPLGVRISRADVPAVELAVQPDQRLVLGRHDAADLSFDDAQVSRLHGLMRSEPDRLSYQDLGSSNGSRLLRRGQPPIDLEPRQSCDLVVGDVVELGSPASRFEVIAEIDEPAPQVQVEGRSQAARDFDRNLRLAARTKAPVFLLGPSGCGKTRSARRIHELSSSEGLFVPVNCARLPVDASALHSELLGHVRGAFTGADSDRRGRLMLADGGTLFLDEVESLSPLAQGFLLDLLEGSGDLAPLGSKQPLKRAPIFRLISASKTPLADSGLRDDLCERLAEGHLWQVPSLEQRREDIPALMLDFAREQGRLLGVEVSVEEGALEFSREASWPGQIRQLRAAVRVAAQLQVAEHDGPGVPRKIVVTRAQIQRHLEQRRRAFGGTRPGISTAPITGDGPLRQKADPRQLTPQQVLAVLRDCDGNQSEAARRLGIARNTLAKKIREMDL